MTQQSKMAAAFERAKPGIGRQAELMRELSALIHRFTVRGVREQ